MNLVQRVGKLEKTLGKPLQQVRLVLSDEEEAQARNEIGEEGMIIHVRLIAPGGERVPFNRAH